MSVSSNNLNNLVATFTAANINDLLNFMGGASLKYASIKDRHGLSVTATWISEGEEIDFHDEVIARDLELFDIEYQAVSTGESK